MNTETPPIKSPLDGSVYIQENSSLIHLLLQGMPKTGKTIGAATFPNIIWLAFESHLYARVEDIKIIHEIDITKFPVIPFNNPSFCKKILEEEHFSPRELNGVINSKEAFYLWLRRNLLKFSPETTLVLDSWTALQEHFDVFQEHDKKITRDGKEDDYYFWAQKIVYSEKVAGLLDQLPCNLVVICHEAQERDKNTGKLLEKTQPLMQGKFITKFKKYFTHCFRALVIAEEDEKFKPVIDPITKKVKVRYVWQTSSDATFDASAGVGYPMYVEANYQSLLKKGVK